MMVEQPPIDPQTPGRGLDARPVRSRHGGELIGYQAMTGAPPTPMPRTRDPFIDAADAALADYISRERRSVSWTEVILAAGFTESQKAGVFYHLNRTEHTGERPHAVPPHIVYRLASVLGHEKELKDAAHEAAGWIVVDDAPASDDVTLIVQRFYGSSEPTQEERDAVTAELMRMAAEEMTRRSGRSSREHESATGE